MTKPKGFKAKFRKHYLAFRRVGYRACEAARGARTLTFWEREADVKFRVRITAEPEQESFFDVYGQPDGYTDKFGRTFTPAQEREEIQRQIDRLGCWTVFSEYFDGTNWQHADSIGMCIYADPTCPLQNCYVTDLMQSALDKLESL